MAVLLNKLWRAYYLLSEELPDPRTKSWPLVVTPIEGLSILAVYSMFVLVWGPKWMKNRPAYNVDKLLIIHNIIQILACGYIFYECLVYMWAWEYRWVCEPIDFSNSPKAVRVAVVVYHYYLTKFLDLFDTVFFVLRKKFNQVSFLHVFHHANMVLVSWSALSYLPGGHGTFVGLVNSFVHVVMYGYYLLTVMRPATKQSLWWKKHLTQLQIVQLAMTCFHFSLILVTPNCQYPSWVVAAVLPSDLFLLGLFLDFYVKNYIKKNNKSIENTINVGTTTEDLKMEVKEYREYYNNSSLHQRATSVIEKNGENRK